MSWVSTIFSGLFQGFLSLFGMSDAQKLGLAQKTEETHAQILTEVKEANDIEDKDASASDPASAPSRMIGNFVAAVDRPVCKKGAGNAGSTAKASGRSPFSTSGFLYE
jgi:hypothetical protein